MESICVACSILKIVILCPDCKTTSVVKIEMDKLNYFNILLYMVPSFKNITLYKKKMFLKKPCFEENISRNYNDFSKYISGHN